jgi:circadian clock protein KaiC
MIDRMRTGIPGLDGMIDGGLPVPSLILVAGDVGSGRTTLCSQFLFRGAALGETGICFLTLNGSPEWSLKLFSTYEFTEARFLGNEIKLVNLEEFLEGSPCSEEVLGGIARELDNHRPRRVVIDCLSHLEDRMDSYRRFLQKLSGLIKKNNAVALVTGDCHPGEPYPVEIAQIADGVILLHNTEEDFVRRRSIGILKMCGTAHHLGRSAVDISSRGIMVYSGL